MSDYKFSRETTILNRPFSIMNSVILNLVLDYQDCDAVTRLIQQSSTHFGVLRSETPKPDCLLSMSIQSQDKLFWKWLIHTFMDSNSIGVSLVSRVDTIEGLERKHILEFSRQAYANEISFIRPVKYKASNGKEDVRLQLKTNGGFFMPFYEKEFEQIQTMLEEHPDLLLDTPYGGLISQLNPSKKIVFKDLIFRRDSFAILTPDMDLYVSFLNYEICLAILRFNQSKCLQTQNNVFNLA